MKKFFVVSMLLTILAIPGFSKAQEGKKAITTLEEVVVTATKYETEQMETPAFVTVITAEELKKTGGRSLVEALRTISGLGYTSDLTHK